MNPNTLFFPSLLFPVPLLSLPFGFSGKSFVVSSTSVIVVAEEDPTPPPTSSVDAEYGFPPAEEGVENDAC